MADAAARREARKRRILENSEIRLQKIAGRNEESARVICETGAKPSTSKSANGLSVDEAFIRNESACLLQEGINPTPSLSNFDVDKLFHDLNSEEGVLAFKSLLSDLQKNDTNRDDAYEIDDTGLRHRPVADKRSNLDGRTDPATKVVRESNCDINTADADASISETSLSFRLLSSKWIIVLLAAIVNVLFILKLDHLFGKTILVPFFVMMLGRLLILQDKTEAQGGTMLTAALILCNVRPELVYRLKWFMRVTTRVTEEFAIYIFSFVIMYNAISSYWADIDALIAATDAANKAEVNQYTDA